MMREKDVVVFVCSDKFYLKVGCFVGASGVASSPQEVIHEREAVRSGLGTRWKRIWSQGKEERLASTSDDG